MTGEGIREFLSMGGYAPYVWSSYAVTVVVLVGVLLHSLYSLRDAETVLQALDRPARRKAARPPVDSGVVAGAPDMKDGCAPDATDGGGGSDGGGGGGDC